MEGSLNHGSKILEDIKMSECVHDRSHLDICSTTFVPVR